MTLTPLDNEEGFVGLGMIHAGDSGDIILSSGAATLSLPLGWADE
jgi:hypothetical protein